MTSRIIEILSGGCKSALCDTASAEPLTIFMRELPFSVTVILIALIAVFIAATILSALFTYKIKLKRLKTSADESSDKNEDENI